MTSRSPAKLTWMLALVVAALSVGSEELHYVPGSGHVARVGKTFLRFGLPQLDSAPRDDADGWTVTGSANRPFPILDSSSCAICKKTSTVQVLGGAIDWESPPPLVQKVGAAGAPVVDRSSARSVQPRAPPAA